MSIRTLLRALWIGLILFSAGIQPVSSETRRVILLFDERSELPGLEALDAWDCPSRAQSSKLMVGAYGRRTRLTVAPFFAFGFQYLNGAPELPRSGLPP